MLKDDISNVFNFQQCLLFWHSRNHRCNSKTQISAGTWRTVHEHIVADAFRSRRRARQRYLFLNSKYHQNNAFQVVFQLLMMTLAVTTRSWSQIQVGINNLSRCNLIYIYICIYIYIYMYGCRYIYNLFSVTFFYYYC